MLCIAKIRIHRSASLSVAAGASFCKGSEAYQESVRYLSIDLGLDLDAVDNVADDGSEAVADGALGAVGALAVAVAHARGAEDVVAVGAGRDGGGESNGEDGEALHFERVGWVGWLVVGLVRRKWW